MRRALPGEPYAAGATAGLPPCLSPMGLVGGPRLKPCLVHGTIGKVGPGVGVLSLWGT
ncbi:MAG: hypothetical protein RMK29_11310 [Myxococcales bacterium]|nr:hypothetical protein [Myxococcales bacterium]